MVDGLASSPGASPENPVKEVRFTESIQHRGQMVGGVHVVTVINFLTQQKIGGSSSGCSCCASQINRCGYTTALLQGSPWVNSLGWVYTGF